ncbi:hypothetical protein KVT40_008714 [Elsinoe batatas]|uniref:Glutathione S-transferase kappa n=1 Tax=Elsinoe batatas TaxID=2601811 RepID=A0A8K0L0U7_9PEZI|nr:hypothetical protein KVT40_008714 [Elsinoe batatas]
MAPPKLTVYIDIVSPFGYLAFHVINTSPIFKSCEVKYIPVLLGGIMKACNNTPPLRIKNKDKWVNKDRLRWAEKFNIPISQRSPEGFPHNTVSPMRALSALQLSSPEQLPAAITELYKAYWVEGKPIDQPDVYGGALEKAIGSEEAKKVVEAISNPDVKQHLGRNTDEALASGAFGMPWILATNAQGQTEGFWGFDHLGLVMDFLGLERGGGREARALL